MLNIFKPVFASMIAKIGDPLPRKYGSGDPAKNNQDPVVTASAIVEKASSSLLKAVWRFIKILVTDTDMMC